jgi:hypothetical protein
MILTRQNRKLRKTCPGATFSTTVPPWTDPDDGGSACRFIFREKTTWKISKETREMAD